MTKNVNDYILEPVRTTTLKQDCDVIVCGGGPAGWAAAVSAARAGAGVRLIELHGQLGGIWTSGYLSYVLDAGNKAGLMSNLVNKLETNQPLHYDTSNKEPWTHKSFFYDAEVMKVVLEEVCIEVGVQIRLHTRVVGAVVNDKRLTHVITESKSGREAWSARVFIDATGDGDLAALSGCKYDMGHPDDGSTQPMSLLALLTGPPPQVLEPCVYAIDGHTEEAWDSLQRVLAEAGAPPSYSKPVLVWIRDNLYALMANHAYGFNGTDADDLTAATLLTRQEVHQQVRALKSLGGAWNNINLVATASQIGVREARRIHGRYTVSVQDLIEGRSQPDAVCRVNFPVDVHATSIE